MDLTNYVDGGCFDGFWNKIEIPVQEMNWAEIIVSSESMMDIERT